MTGPAGMTRVVCSLLGNSRSKPFMALPLAAVAASVLRPVAKVVVTAVAKRAVTAGLSRLLTGRPRAAGEKTGPEADGRAAEVEPSRKEGVPNEPEFQAVEPDGQTARGAELSGALPEAPALASAEGSARTLDCGYPPLPGSGERFTVHDDGGEKQQSSRGVRR